MLASAMVSTQMGDRGNAGRQCWLGMYFCARGRGGTVERRKQEGEGEGRRGQMS